MNNDLKRRPFRKLGTGWLALFVCAALAYFIQMHIYLYKDNASILHVATILLHGGMYGKDIFDPTPPMILYLNLPAVLLTKLGFISLLSALRIYILTLAIVSASCCYYFIKILFKNNPPIRYFLFGVLMYVLFFLPAQQFAQREHFMLILTLPYFFSLAMRIENKTINASLTFFIGLAAGIGFAIKPHFLPPLLFVELYYMWEKRSLLSWVRMETIVIISILITYFFAVMVFYPGYFQIVLPLWLPYYTLIKHSWFTVLTYPQLIFCLATMLCYFLMQRINQLRKIRTLLFFALLGCIVTFLLPQVAWYYHSLPAIGIAALLTAIMYGQCMQILHLRLKKGFMVLGGMIAFSIPLVTSIVATASSIHYFNERNSTGAQLIQFLKQNRPNNSFDYFNVTHELLALEFYTDAPYVGSFPFFPWEYYHHTLISFCDLTFPNKTTAYGVQVVANELNAKKPRFILVDTTSSLYFLGKTVDYVKEYSANKQFKAAWSHYHYLKTVANLQVYERSL